MAKITIESIKEVLQPQCWDVISDTYKNLDQELEFKCPEGHIVHNSWKRMREHPKCPRCESNEFINKELIVTKKKSGSKRILALDQSSHVTGFSIYDDKELIGFSTYNAKGTEEIERLDNIKSWLLSMITNWKPDYVALEGIQYEQNFGVTVFQTLARLQGILMIVCYENKIPFILCPTNTWRNRAGVKGRARADRKRSAQLIIKEKYDVTATDDEADAILIGQYVAQTIKSSEIVEWE